MTTIKTRTFLLVATLASHPSDKVALLIIWYCNFSFAFWVIIRYCNLETPTQFHDLPQWRKLRRLYRKPLLVSQEKLLHFQYFVILWGQIKWISLYQNLIIMVHKKTIHIHEILFFWEGSFHPQIQDFMDTLCIKIKATSQTKTRKKTSISEGCWLARQW